MSNAASRPEDFTPETALIELPRRNAAGSPLRVLVAAVPRAKLLALFGGLPSASSKEDKPDATLDESVRAKLEAESLERWRSVMRLGAIEPRLAFAEGEPGVQWDSLDALTQESWQAAILSQSGFKLTQEADEMLRFRYVERGGIAVGGGGDGPVPAAEAAA